jgi:hypothetical protein
MSEGQCRNENTRTNSRSRPPGLPNRSYNILGLVNLLNTGRKADDKSGVQIK